MNMILNAAACGVMVIGLWLLLKLNRNAARNPKAKLYCVLIFCVLLISGGFFLYNTGTLAPLGIGKTTTEHVMDVETAIAAACGFKVGEFMVKKGDTNAGILLLTESGYENDPRYQAVRRKLIAAGVPDSGIATDVVLDDAATGRTGTPVAARMTPADFDRAAKRHPECKYVMTLVGMPMSGPQNVSFVKSRYRDGAQQLIATASQYDRGALLYGVANGNVAAVIDKKEDAIYTVESLPSSDDAIFALRYELLTK